MERIAELLKKIREESKITPEQDGAVVLADPIPGTKPADYCYEMFAPLKDAEIEELAANYRCRFPQALRDFYRLSNGMFLFGRHISIHGVPDWGARYKQPVSLVFSDGHRPDNCPDSRLFFATYQGNPQTQMFFDTDDPDENMPVYAAKDGSNEIIRSWPSFADWLISEHEVYLGRYARGEFRYVDIVEGILRSVDFDNPEE